MYYTLTHPNLQLSSGNRALLIDLDDITGAVKRLCGIADHDNVTTDDYLRLSLDGNDSPVSVLGISHEEFDKLVESGSLKRTHQPSNLSDLNKQQKIAVESYALGDFSHVDSLHDAEGVGDTLFLFIMRELSDDEDCESMDAAVKRMKNAMSEIQRLITALEQKG